VRKTLRAVNQVRLVQKLCNWNSFLCFGEVGGAFSQNAGQSTSFFVQEFSCTNKYIDIRPVRYEDYTDFDTNQVALRLWFRYKDRVK
jgi:hypothetical protein